MTGPQNVPDPLPPTPKKRNTKHYKAIAKAAEKLAADRLTALEDARAESQMWQNTNASSYWLFKVASGIAFAEFAIILWLVFGR